MGVGHAAVFQCDSRPLGVCLSCLIDVSTVGELDGRFPGAIRVLAVAVAAIEKRVHDLFSEASSGPRSMA